MESVVLGISPPQAPPLLFKFGHLWAQKANMVIAKLQSTGFKKASKKPMGVITAPPSTNHIVYAPNAKLQHYG